MQIELLEETEGPTGWTFRLHALDDEGVLHPFAVRLSWVDYNHWSPSGNDQPGHVAVAVLQFMLEQQSIDDVRAKFDAATVRRLHADADTRIPMLLPNVMP